MTVVVQGHSLLSSVGHFVMTFPFHVINTVIDTLQYLFANLQILFALAEALHAHGHTQEACRLARQLAEDLLAADAIACAPVDYTSHHKGDDLVLQSAHLTVLVA